MNERQEYKGYWWFPSEPDQNIAGTLTYIPNERITLSLIGPIGTPVELFDSFHDREEPIIHGMTSNAQKVTLANCNSSIKMNFSCGFPIIYFQCQYAIIGKHLDSIGQKCFFRAFVHIPVLSYWAPTKALENMINFKDKSIKKITVSFTTGKKTIDKVKINTNTTISINNGVDYNGEHLSPQIKQYSYMEILKCKNTSIWNFCSIIMMFEQFLSLAALDAVKCSKIILFDRSIYQEYSDNKKTYHPIQLIYNQYEPANESRQWKDRDFLFDYTAISEQFPAIIKKWYHDQSDLSPIRAHLIESIAHKKVFSSIDFLVVIQALEGFWWRFKDQEYRQKTNQKGNTSLKTIVREIKQDFSDVRCVKKMRINLEKVVDSRHYYSHFMNKSKKPQTLDGIELYKLTDKLRILLICCVLSFIGLDHQQINNLLNKSNNQYIKL